MSDLTRTTWSGWLRHDGRKGVRNLVLIIYTVECAQHVANAIAAGEEDVHVALLISSPSLATPRTTITDPVETRQIACTILHALGMGCIGLGSEQIEPSTFLQKKDGKK